MRPSVLIHLLCLSVAVGGLAIGHGLCAGMLDGGFAEGLIDANLAKSITTPLLSRCDDVLIGTAVLMAIVSRHALEQAAATALSLLLFVGASAHRFGVLPKLTESWSRVDLVAQRPASRYAEALHWEQVHFWSLLGMALLVLVLLVLTARVFSKALTSANSIRSRTVPDTSTSQTIAL